MRLVTGNEVFYSIYVTQQSIELVSDCDRIETGRLVCTQKNYQSILNFGRDLAKHKSMSFINHVDPFTTWISESP